LIATLPALCLYVLGVLLSPDLEIVKVTWDLPLRIIAASAVLMIPTASLALCISSLTEESRYAGFAWFAVWVLGWFTFSILRSVETIGSSSTGDRPSGWWSLLSLYHTLGGVQTWIFGFAEFRDIWTSAIVLISITIASTVLLFWRVSAPLRA
jgi:hypothetical protein